MKKYTAFLIAIMMMFSFSLRAENYACEPCGYDYSCAPCATSCGTNCGMNLWCAGIAAAAVVGVIIAIATNCDDPHFSH